MNTYFCDIEGKIPAKDGDLIALVRGPFPDQDLIQPQISHRPVLVNGSPQSCPEEYFTRIIGDLK